MNNSILRKGAKFLKMILFVFFINIYFFMNQQVLAGSCQEFPEQRNNEGILTCYKIQVHSCSHQTSFDGRIAQICGPNDREMLNRYNLGLLGTNYQPPTKKPVDSSGKSDKPQQPGNPDSPNEENDENGLFSLGQWSSQDLDPLREMIANLNTSNTLGDKNKSIDELMNAQSEEILGAASGNLMQRQNQLVQKKKNLNEDFPKFRDQSLLRLQTMSKDLEENLNQAKNFNEKIFNEESSKELREFANQLDTPLLTQETIDKLTKKFLSDVDSSYLEKIEGHATFSLNRSQEREKKTLNKEISAEEKAQYKGMEGARSRFTDLKSQGKTDTVFDNEEEIDSAEALGTAYIYFAKKQLNEYEEMTVARSLKIEAMALRYYATGIWHEMDERSRNLVPDLAKMINTTGEIVKDPTKTWNKITDLYEKFDSKELYTGIGLFLEKKGHEFVNASDYERGKMAGAFTFEMLAVIFTMGESGIVSAGRAVRLSKNLNAGIVDGAKLPRTILGISDSAAKTGIKGQEGIIDFSNTIKRLSGNEIGAVGKIDEILDSTKNIWSKISNQAENITGTSIPSRFNIEAAGLNFHVHPNGTKHMGTRVISNSQSHGSPMYSQMVLSQFEKSVTKVAQSGEWKQAMLDGKVIMSEGWELKFSQREGDLLPVIMHAVYKGN